LNPKRQVGGAQVHLCETVAKSQHVAKSDFNLSVFKTVLRGARHQGLYCWCELPWVDV